MSASTPIITAPPQRPGDSSSSYAASAIRAAILDGVLEPGSVIPQGALAEQLGMSRIPVRDALRQLETEGLVSIPANKAARVSRLDLDEFVEIYDLREMVEPYAVAQSAARLTRQELERVATLAAMFDASTHSTDELLRVDREFHMLTMSAAPGQRVRRLIDELQNASQRFRRAYHLMARDDALGPVSHDHHALVSALTARDADASREIALRHIRRTRGLLEPILHQELGHP
ncbi:GntR family transcriptional regulator [Agromyces silvae]|uniref:GntR family transcriptional regulator n=1 Tax=Agromyces silvae TaxID=3388266 RepID=UPI00280B005A|nr:GntR family transcriptional regulator [Agromyces protaetiae]